MQTQKLEAMRIVVRMTGQSTDDYSLNTSLIELVKTTRMKLPSCSGSWRRLSERERRKGSKRSEQTLKPQKKPWLTRMQEREKVAAEEAAREHDIALGNPLLNPKSDFNVKRRYVAAKWNIPCRVAPNYHM